MNLKRYIGNPDVFAVQGQNGYYPERRPLTDADLRDHVAGSRTLGTYVVKGDRARFMVFDDDTNDRALVNRIVAECRSLGLSAGVEESGRKGYHVWVLFAQWESAAEVKRLADFIASKAGFNGEVFPKQTAVRDLGNLVKLPGGVHRVTGKRSRFLGPEPMVTPHPRFAQALGKVPAPVAKPHQPRSGVSVFPCVDSIQENPPGPGQRNVLLFHFATHLRRMGLHDEQVEAVMLTVTRPEDLDPGEFEQILENSRFSGPICDQLPADRRCPAEDCVKTRKRYNQRPGQLRHAAEGESVVVKVGARLPGAGVINLEHPDIEVAKAALNNGGD